MCLVDSKLDLQVFINILSFLDLSSAICLRYLHGLQEQLFQIKDNGLSPHRVYGIVLGFEKQNFLPFTLICHKNLVCGSSDGPLVMI